MPAAPGRRFSYRFEVSLALVGLLGAGAWALGAWAGGWHDGVKLALAPLCFGLIGLLYTPPRLWWGWWRRSDLRTLRERP